MIVVSDTSPLNYLVLIQAIDVLPSLFGEVLIPPAVARELTHPKSPGPVCDWLSARPNWLQIWVPSRPLAIGRLGPGEVEAIALALEVDADQLLIDDAAGKKAAKRLGLSAVGVLAVLDLAGRRGLLDFPKALSRLEAETNFRLSPALRDALLREHQQSPPDIAPPSDASP